MATIKIVTSSGTIKQMCDNFENAGSITLSWNDIPLTDYITNTSSNTLILEVEKSGMLVLGEGSANGKQYTPPSFYSAEIKKNETLELNITVASVSIPDSVDPHGINITIVGVTLSDYLTEIANAIRTKKGTSDNINAQFFAYEIGKIDTALPTQTKIATPTTSSQTIKPDSGYVLSQVTVNAIPSSYIIPSGTLEITANGEHDVKNYEKVNVSIETGVSEDDIYTELLNTKYGDKAIISFTIAGTSYQAEEEMT